MSGLTPQPQSVALSGLTELGRLSFLGLTPQAMNLPRLRRSIVQDVEVPPISTLTKLSVVAK